MVMTRETWTGRRTGKRVAVQQTGGGGGNRPAPRFAYTEKFYQVFPYYLAIGMTYEQFWEMDCDLVKYYRKAARIRQDLKNQDAMVARNVCLSGSRQFGPHPSCLCEEGCQSLNPILSNPLN